MPAQSVGPFDDVSVIEISVPFAASGLPKFKDLIIYFCEPSRCQMLF